MKDESFYLLQYKKYFLQGKESIFFLKYATEDGIFEKKEISGQR
jgi:hypothetical protein